MSFRAYRTAANALRAPLRVNLHSTRTPPKIDPHAVSPLPPVIMVHGVLASESTYRSIMKRSDFVPRREIIGVDMRNHGKSPHLAPEDGMAYEDMAGDLCGFMDAEGIEKACIIGHSMGGKVAMQLALSEPERVSELVVVDIAPIKYTLGKGPDDPFTVTRAMAAIDLDRVQSRSEIDAALLNEGVTSEAVRQFVMTNLTSFPQENSKYKWKVNLPAVVAGFPSIVNFPGQHGRSYNGPTCVIRGGKSNYVPFMAMRVVTSLFPNTKLVTISEAGHWLQAQAPNDFCRAVNEFLRD